MVIITVSDTTSRPSLTNLEAHLSLSLSLFSLSLSFSFSLFIYLSLSIYLLISVTRTLSSKASLYWSEVVPVKSASRWFRGRRDATRELRSHKETFSFGPDLVGAHCIVPFLS